MALSDDLREELAAISPSNECDRLAELSGLFHVAGRAAPARVRQIAQRDDPDAVIGQPPHERSEAWQTAAVRDDHQRGWSAAFDALERFLNAKQ